MTTLKQIPSQTCPGDWFMLLDLKDAYFHIQVAPPSHTILEIHIRGDGVSIQGPPVWAVPGSPHFYAMHGCGSLPSATDGNLHPQLPRRLILAQSQAVSTLHKTLLLSHLCCLGLRVNFAKSILSPSQRVSFLGTVINSVQMTETVSAE